MPGVVAEPAAQPQAGERGQAPPDRGHVDERVRLLVRRADAPTPAPARWPRRRRAARRRAGGRGTSRLGQRGQHAREALHAVHDEVGALDDRGRALVGAHAHADRRVERPSPDQLVRARRRRRGRWCRRRRTAPCARPTAPPARAPPGPCRTRTGGRTSSTLRPQWMASPSASASAASSSRCACASSSSGTSRQCSATIGPLSSMRTRSRRSSGVSRAETKLFTRPPSSRTPRRCWPARRPARAARRRASRRRRCRPRRRGGAPRPPSGPRCRPRGRSGAPAGPAAARSPRLTRASSARRTIGASTPSMSHRTAARSGSARSG